MTATKTICTEGDLIAVPLPSHGYSLGLVAGTNAKGVVLGYFFGPIRDSLPKMEDANNIKPEEAVLIAIFGDLGFAKGGWKIIGRFNGYQFDEWPVPPLIRMDSVSKVLSKAIYTKENLLREARLEPCTEEEGRKLHRDGLYGYGAVELKLAKLLE